MSSPPVGSREELERIISLVKNGHFLYANKSSARQFTSQLLDMTLMFLNGKTRLFDSNMVCFFKSSCGTADLFFNGIPKYIVTRFWSNM